MEAIFARDMLNVLIRRKIKLFEIADDKIEHLASPFCFRIRRAVENHVALHDLAIYNSIRCYKKGPYHFRTLVSYQREHILPTLKNLVELLKHMSEMCMMAAWCCKFGERNAPKEALEELSRMLGEFVSMYDNPATFWRRMRAAAPYVMNRRPLTTAEKQRIFAVIL